MGLHEGVQEKPQHRSTKKKERSERAGKLENTTAPMPMTMLMLTTMTPMMVMTMMMTALVTLVVLAECY
jgi:hypothetical protein